MNADQVIDAPPTTGIDRLLGGLGVALRAELDQLQAERVEANTRLMAVDAQIRKARKLLGIVEPDAPDVVGTKPSKKGKMAKGNGTTVAEWREDDVVRVITESKNGMSTMEVAQALGWKEATARIAINQARDKELVWKAGVSGKSHNANIWKAYDGD